MFKCYECGKTSKSGEPQHRKVVERRPKTYTYGRYKRNKITNGWEIVREAALCDTCNAIFEKESPDVHV